MRHPFAVASLLSASACSFLYGKGPCGPHHCQRFVELVLEWLSTAFSTSSPYCGGRRRSDRSLVLDAFSCFVTVGVDAQAAGVAGFVAQPTYLLYGNQVARFARKFTIIKSSLARALFAPNAYRYISPNDFQRSSRTGEFESPIQGSTSKRVPALLG